MQFALNGYSLVHSGTSEYGQTWPFYFRHLDSFWATPIVTYAVAGILTFLPFDIWSIRLTTVLISILSMVIISILAYRIFNKKHYAIFALLLFATTPAFYINSRLLLDNVYPVLFVSIWLYLLRLFIDRRNNNFLLISGFALGVGIHSYHAAKILIPFYYMITLVFLVINRTSRKALMLFSLGFVMPILLFVPWLLQHPDTLLNQVSYASSIDKSINVNQGYLAVFSGDRFVQYIKSYLSYFHQKVLFFEGDRTLVHSTKEIGVFLFPLVFLIVFGLLEVIKRKEFFSKLITVGFFTYPLAAALINDPQRVSRGLVVIPFAVLLSLYGINFMCSSKERLLKVLLGFLAVMILVQFSFFLIDYFGSYRTRSASAFNNDIGGAMESAINSTRLRNVTRIYLADNIPFAQKYFKFYSIKNNSSYKNISLFSPNADKFTSFPVGSLVVIKPEDIGTRENKIESFEKIEVIREPDGTESYWLFYRD